MALKENKTEKIIVVKFETKDALLYGGRLLGFLQLLHDIDHGLYPNRFWGTNDVDQNAGSGSPLVNVWPEKYQRNNLTGEPVLGLRNAILHAIDGSLGWVRDHGSESDKRMTQLLVDADRERQKKEGTL